MIYTLLNKLKNLVRNTKISSSQQDGSYFYNAQITYMNSVLTSTICYPYGLFCNAPINSMGLTFNSNGFQENPITIPYGVNNRFIGLKSGEVLVGNPQTQTSIKFDEDGNVDITSTAKVTISTASEVSIVGNLIVSGTISSGGEITALSDTSNPLTFTDIQTKYNDHIHEITVGSLSYPTTTPDPQI